MTDETTVKVHKDRVRLDALAKRARERRAEKNMLDAANASLDAKRAIQEQTWQRNIEALSPKQRDELNARIETYNYICYDLAYDGALRMSSGEAYGHDEFFQMWPERWLKEIEQYAAQNPPNQSYKSYDFQQAPTKDMGSDFYQFGVATQINEVSYNWFLAEFRDWYRANRAVLELQVDHQPYSVTWEEVDRLMLLNPRLGKIKPTLPAPPREIAEPVAPRPLNEAEQIQKTLNDLSGNIGAGEI